MVQEVSSSASNARRRLPIGEIVDFDKVPGSRLGNGWTVVGDGRRGSEVKLTKPVGGNGLLLETQTISRSDFEKAFQATTESRGIRNREKLLFKLKTDNALFLGQSQIRILGIDAARDRGRYLIEIKTPGRTIKRAWVSRHTLNKFQDASQHTNVSLLLDFADEAGITEEMKEALSNKGVLRKTPAVAPLQAVPKDTNQDKDKKKKNSNNSDEDDDDPPTEEPTTGQTQQDAAQTPQETPEPPTPEAAEALLKMGAAGMAVQTVLEGSEVSQEATTESREIEYTSQIEPEGEIETNIRVETTAQAPSQTSSHIQTQTQTVSQSISPGSSRTISQSAQMATPFVEVTAQIQNQLQTQQPNIGPSEARIALELLRQQQAERTAANLAGATSTQIKTQPGQTSGVQTAELGSVDINAARQEVDLRAKKALNTASKALSQIQIQLQELKAIPDDQPQNISDQATLARQTAIQENLQKRAQALQDAVAALKNVQTQTKTAKALQHVQALLQHVRAYEQILGIQTSLPTGEAESAQNSPRDQLTPNVAKLFLNASQRREDAPALGAVPGRVLGNLSPAKRKPLIFQNPTSAARRKNATDLSDARMATLGTNNGPDSESPAESLDDLTNQNQLMTINQAGDAADDIDDDASAQKNIGDEPDISARSTRANKKFADEQRQMVKTQRGLVGDNDAGGYEKIIDGQKENPLNENGDGSDSPSLDVQRAAALRAAQSTDMRAQYDDGSNTNDAPAPDSAVTQATRGLSSLVKSQVTRWLIRAILPYLIPILLIFGLIVLLVIFMMSIPSSLTSTTTPQSPTQTSGSANQAPARAAQ